MVLWIISGLVVMLVVGLAIEFPMRWGRGAMGASFKQPENEIQNSTPWKGPPTF